MASTSTVNGLSTPPLPVAQPLVYITGTTRSEIKQVVAEYITLLLGEDEAILIDHPYTSTMTPPPPSSTPPHESSSSPSSSSSRPTPSNNRMPSSSSSRPSRSRSTSTVSVAQHHPPTPFFDPLLTTLSSYPLRTAILTDTKRPSQDPDTISPAQAANQTGRPLIRARLVAQASSSSSSDQHATPTQSTLVFNLNNTESDPHAVAVRLVQFVKEINAWRRSQGDWEAVNDHDETQQTLASGNGPRDCVCGVITPVLTPAEEREMRF